MNCWVCGFLDVEAWLKLSFHDFVTNGSVERTHNVSSVYQKEIRKANTTMRKLARNHELSYVRKRLLCLSNLEDLHRSCICSESKKTISRIDFCYLFVRDGSPLSTDCY